MNPDQAKTKGRPRISKRRGRKRRGTQFIDVAFDGYIRYLALDKWRIIDEAISLNGLSMEQAYQEAGDFQERGPYAPLWTRRWAVQKAASVESSAHPLAWIETALRSALEEEREARKAKADPSIEDTLHYKAFMDQAMESLLEEASGEIEEFE